MRQGGRRTSMFLNINKWFLIRLIWDIKLCSQIMLSLDWMHKCAQLLCSPAEQMLNIRVWFNQVSLDNQSEIDINKSSGWILQSCSSACIVNHKPKVRGWKLFTGSAYCVTVAALQWQWLPSLLPNPGCQGIPQVCIAPRKRQTRQCRKQYIVVLLLWHSALNKWILKQAAKVNILQAMKLQCTVFVTNLLHSREAATVSQVIQSCKSAELKYGWRVWKESILSKRTCILQCIV